MGHQGAKGPEKGKRSSVNGAGWGGGHPSSTRGGCCITLFNPRCTSEVGVGAPPPTQMGQGDEAARATPGQWSRKEPRLGVGDSTARWTVGGGTAGPESGQGMVEGVAGLPGQVGPAWQGGWGGQQGGVFWVWGKASALPVAIVSD